MEEVIISQGDIAECLVVGMLDEIKGEIPYAIIVLKNNSTIKKDEIQKQLTQIIWDWISPIACLKDFLICSKLPKTRSGKILRNVVKRIINNTPYKIPSTIEDNTAIDEIITKFKQMTYSNKNIYFEKEENLFVNDVDENKN